MSTPRDPHPLARLTRERLRELADEAFEVQPAKRNGEPATARRFSIQSHGGTREHPERSD